jgi:hypothetical protein
MISRRGVGTAVFGGMLAASSIGIFLIPMLYDFKGWNDDPGLEEGVGSYREVTLLNTDGNGKQPPKAFHTLLDPARRLASPRAPALIARVRVSSGKIIAYYALKFKRK